MGVLRFKYNIKALIDSYQLDPSMIRLFGRFHDSRLGISTRVLLQTINFSTHQTLSTSELFIMDKRTDDLEEFEGRVLAMSRHLERNSKDPSIEINLPYVFMTRAKAVYQSRNRVLDLNVFKSI